MPEILVVTRNLGLQNSLEKQFRLKINSSCFNNTYLHFFPTKLIISEIDSGWTETPNFWYPKHITIGSRLIDFSLYWNWCRWFSVLLLCKSNSYVLEMMNDEVLGMECTSLFLLFFRENENSRKYAHALFLDICHHTNNITYMHNTFWHLHIWIFQTETFLVILRKRWTSSNILLYVSFFYSY